MAKRIQLKYDPLPDGEQIGQALPIIKPAAKKAEK